MEIPTLFCTFASYKRRQKMSDKNNRKENTFKKKAASEAESLEIQVIDTEEKKAILNLTIDTNICPVIDYFEIFMERTKMSKRAAKYLGLWFELIINDTNLL